MEKRYKLIFDDVIIKQLKKAAKNNQIKTILTKMLDSIELNGPLAGKLLDSKLSVYETKNKHPPIRLYYKCNENDQVMVFEFEMKTSKESQQRTLKKIRKKVLET